MHKALEQAVKLRYIGINPADACTLPRMEKRETKPLTEKEIVDFLHEIENGEPLKDLFTVALFTGMREGEICGLSWNTVDFINGTITVKQQLCKEKKKGGVHYIAATKNDKSRTLTVAPFVMDILKRVFREQKEKRFAAGLAWNNEWNLVFTNELGRHIVPAVALKRFKAVAKRIGREDARFHDLRHPYVKHTTKIFSLGLSQVSQVKSSKTKKHTKPRVEQNPSFLCTHKHIFVKSSCFHIK